MENLSIALAGWEVPITIGIVFIGLALLIFLLKILKIRFKIGPLEFDFTEGNTTKIPSEHRDYLIFTAVLFRFMIQVKDMIRLTCVQNGIANMPDADWIMHREEKVNAISEKAHMFLTANLRGTTLINASDYLSNASLCNEIRDRISDLHDMLRDVAIIQYQIAKDKEDELNMLADDWKKDVLASTCDGKDVLNMLLEYGEKMVKIHDIRTRNLVYIQMIKAEEKLAIISDIFTNHFTRLLAEKMENKK